MKPNKWSHSPWEILSGHSQYFFYWQNFAKFQPEKYDFEQHKGFFMRKKMAQIRQILKEFFFFFKIVRFL
jgi:hypothetical protein